jgi:chondroitin 4-sulfotransferase 11
VPRDFDYILIADHAAVYVETPKVACSSIKTALAPLCGVDLAAHGGNPHDLTWPQPTTPGPPFAGLFSFAFVRDPWDRLVSCYRDKLRGEVDDFTSFTIRPGVANCLARFDAFVAGMSFAAFVRAVSDIPDEDADAHFRSQHTFVCDAAGRIVVDAIGRFERLDDDFAAIARRIGMPPRTLPRLQAVRAPSPFAAFYTDETRALVGERFARDVARFGYAAP